MSTTVTLGGKRLGSGNKQEIHLHGYERSTHNLGRVWKSTMAPGTLVPCLKEVALPGDTWEIDLGATVYTHPTIGPLFGSYDIYVDIFLGEMRLYNALLHQNQTDLGRNMSRVKLPLITVKGNTLNPEEPLDNQQINPSCILAYLGIKGIGYDTALDVAGRDFNAITWLMYWDLVKVFYSNKQEEIGAVIHRDPDPVTFDINEAVMEETDDGNVLIEHLSPGVVHTYNLNEESRLMIENLGAVPEDYVRELWMLTMIDGGGNEVRIRATELFVWWQIPTNPNKIIATVPNFDNENIPWLGDGTSVKIKLLEYDYTAVPSDTEPKIVTFPLENLNTMRDNILMAPRNVAYKITDALVLPPYSLLLDKYVPGGGQPNVYCTTFNQEGLALKSYKSDKFNNWINTEWIDGVGGINEVTAVDTSEGNFTISALILNKKLYDMMMRIGVSGGTADDWQTVVYDHKPRGNDEEPVYMGGLVKNIAFQEVISNAQANNQPLGTLAGRGVMGHKHKGGKVVIKVDRPAYIMGIVSIVPNIDYYQGNDWDGNLKTIDDLHKPPLDQIGFQDLITDEMAFWSTNSGGGSTIFRSAGKVPAWLDYQTTVNKVYGNFADENQQMFMVLVRRYEPEFIDEDMEIQIKDLTTYIDPSKYNHVFADTRRDAQNFWVQIPMDIKVRRKMSANVMPNL